MLTGADIIAAKLLVQLGDVSAEDVRKHLHLGDQRPDTSIDLVNLLAAAGLIDAAAYQRCAQSIHRLLADRLKELHP